MLEGIVHWVLRRGTLVYLDVMGVTGVDALDVALVIKGDLD